MIRSCSDLVGETSLIPRSLGATLSQKSVFFASVQPLQLLLITTNESWSGLTPNNSVVASLAGQRVAATNSTLLGMFTNATALIIKREMVNTPHKKKTAFKILFILVQQVLYKILFRLKSSENMLTEKQAAEIYMLKLSQRTRHSNALSPDHCMRSLRGKCGLVAKTYGVSPRSVRDIWNRYTWEEATCHLWEHEQAGTIKISETFLSSSRKAACRRQKRPNGLQCTSPCDKEGDLAWSSCKEAKELDFLLCGSCMVSHATDELICLDDIFDDIAVSEHSASEVDAGGCMQASPGHNTQALSNVGSGDAGSLCGIWPTSFEPEILWSDPAALTENVVDPFYADWPYW